MAIADNFMWFPHSPEIQGETEDEWFYKRKAFEVLTFKFAMSTRDKIDASSDDGDGDGGSSSSGARKNVRAKFEEFTISKPIDSASPMLYKCLSTSGGDEEDDIRIPSAMLAIRKPGGEYLLYLQFIFRDLAITRIEWDGGGGDKAPTETVTFEFNAMGVQYIKQASGGLGDQPFEWRWSTSMNADTLAVTTKPPTSPPSYLPMRLPIPRGPRR